MGKIAKANIQRSDLVDHLESVKHKEGVLMGAKEPVVHERRTITKQAAAKEASTAQQNNSFSNASWSMCVAKIAHVISKRIT